MYQFGRRAAAAATSLHLAVRLNWSGRAIVFLISLAPMMPPGGAAFGQAMIGDIATQPEMSREQWIAHVQEARRKAKEAAAERRKNFVPEVPSRADEERRASERVLTDDSLQQGDIVSTDRGLFLFKGQPDRERRDADFVPLAR